MLVTDSEKKDIGAHFVSNSAEVNGIVKQANGNFIFFFLVLQNTSHIKQAEAVSPLYRTLFIPQTWLAQVSGVV